MKTTTYLYANGVTTKTVTDKTLTPEQYASACAVIREAARKHLASLKSNRPLHETEHIDLMNRVSRIFQMKHKCTQEFSDWKVGEMSVAELQFIDKQS